MICPHCKKAIKYGVTAETIAKARKLREKGHSFRDIEMLLRQKGAYVSFATLSRHLKSDKE